MSCSKNIFQVQKSENKLQNQKFLLGGEYKTYSNVVCAWTQR